MGKKVLSKLDANPERSLMLGDSMSDIEMAQAINMNSCAVSWGSTPANRLTQSSPDFIIADILELHDVLKNSDVRPDFQYQGNTPDTAIAESCITL